MTEYQIALLYSPDLNESSLEELKIKVENLIKESGEIKQTNKIEKIKLSYPVKKKTEAFFAVIYFAMEPEKIPLLKTKLDEEKDILRFLLIKDKLPAENPSEETIKKTHKKLDKGIEAVNITTKNKEEADEMAVEGEKEPKKKLKNKEKKEEINIDEELEKVLNE